MSVTIEALAKQAASYLSARRVPYLTGGDCGWWCIAIWPHALRYFYNDVARYTSFLSEFSMLLLNSRGEFGTTDSIESQDALDSYHQGVWSLKGGSGNILVNPCNTDQAITFMAWAIASTGKGCQSSDTNGAKTRWTYDAYQQDFTPLIQSGRAEDTLRQQLASLTDEARVAGILVAIKTASARDAIQVEIAQLKRGLTLPPALEKIDNYLGDSILWLLFVILASGWLAFGPFLGPGMEDWARPIGGLLVIINSIPAHYLGPAYPVFRVLVGVIFAVGIADGFFGLASAAYGSYSARRIAQLERQLAKTR